MTNHRGLAETPGARIKPGEVGAPMRREGVYSSSLSTWRRQREAADLAALAHARALCQTFFAWYNDQHCHSGIGYMTPYSVHYGLANPKRFKNRRRVLPPMPTAAWINPPPEEKIPTSDPVARTLN